MKTNETEIQNLEIKNNLQQNNNNNLEDVLKNLREEMENYSERQLISAYKNAKRSGNYKVSSTAKSLLKDKLWLWRLAIWWNKLWIIK